MWCWCKSGDVDDALVLSAVLLCGSGVEGDTRAVKVLMVVMAVLDGVVKMVLLM